MGNLCLSEAHYMQINDAFLRHLRNKETTLIYCKEIFLDRSSAGEEAVKAERIYFVSNNRRLHEMREKSIGILSLLEHSDMYWMWIFFKWSWFECDDENFIWNSSNGCQDYFIKDNWRLLLGIAAKSILNNFEIINSMIFFIILKILKMLSSLIEQEIRKNFQSKNIWLHFKD